MTSVPKEDVYSIRKLIREAEAISDEAMIACSKLKLAIVKARQNPELPVDAGQRAIMRLTQAEQQALTMSTSLLRVHDELSKAGREFCGDDDGDMTNVSPSAIGTDMATQVPELA